MLSIEKVDSYYGDFQALRDVNLEVNEGKIVALLGPNAAGKTTLLSTISGMVPYRKGNITFQGQHINAMNPEDIVSLGIALVPEGRRLFGTLTVLENLEMGAYSKHARKDLQKNLEKMFDLFPILKERSSQQAGSLSGGEQQMCAIARGLMTEPRLLMIDEMSLGLSPVLVQEMFKMVSEIAKSGVTIFLVEQQVNHALKVADEAYIMEKGTVVLHGPSSEIANDDYVKTVYLGK
ncbi:MAG: ABC transporter ATP-binding protein [Desulfarculus sp.]|nr:ABC transporter ATP-binding protein [Pseudomonadota bacterium]MBV1715642.1 ABC transporter ATP-binding protein [Desulfarculus sp.]MBU4574885.1 ABC transporter ATP-binding protein [Pseudomonadota bacterium]MBU4600114.1 ABC transporter ATP-binding protein [Pseudomonadota bacterium]MBV1738826.1 ABC transporter ATP-binding protein [Desulfarculus sp.]